MKRIVMDCLNTKCDCIILIKYEGTRENDIEVFCQEIADAMSCPDCNQDEFVVGYR